METWRDQVLRPVVDAILDGGRPTGLVLGGRLAERMGTADADRLARVREAVDAGWVEIVATALHGACLSAIPREDAKGQLRDHITALRRVFGVRPQGCWLPYSTWDPVFPRLLDRSGLRWATLDAAWVRAVGGPEGPVLSLEREGYSILGLLGHRDAGEGVVYLEPREPDGVPAALDVLDAARSPLQAVLAEPPTRAYLPSGSSNGLWEARLLDDDGADALHKRMLRVSRQVRRLGAVVDASTYSDEGPDPMQLRQARRYLYRAQAGGAYGGRDCSLAVRDRAWRDLLRAERTAMEQLGTRVPLCQRVDLDFDGHQEVWLRSTRWSVTLAPGRHGTLSELARLPEAVNIVCGPLPLAFREAFDGVPVAAHWDLVTTETPGEGRCRAILVADSTLDGEPVRLTKGVQVGEKGPLAVRLEIHHRGRDAARGRLTTELFVGLGGKRWSGDPSEPLAVELGGGKEPLDEVIELPPVEALGLAGWRARLDLDLRPPAAVVVEPLPGGLARVEIAWSVELFARDRARREVLVSVREVPDG